MTPDGFVTDPGQIFEFPIVLMEQIFAFVTSIMQQSFDFAMAIFRLAV